MEAELFPHRDELGEMLTGAAVGVVIVVRPAETDLLLSGKLHLRSSIALLPILSLGSEE
jgi:hypothetical protein